MKHKTAIAYANARRAAGSVECPDPEAAARWEFHENEVRSLVLENVNARDSIITISFCARERNWTVEARNELDMGEPKVTGRWSGTRSKLSITSHRSANLSIDTAIEELIYATQQLCDGNADDLAVYAIASSAVDPPELLPIAARPRKSRVGAEGGGRND